VSRERGATMVEFALVSVVAFALIFGLAELGLVVFGNSAGGQKANRLFYLILIQGVRY